MPNNMPDEPLLSVCVQTYLHVDYIKQCLDGILMQKTTFLFEILLGEDDSTDGTRAICIEYAKKHPDKIRLFLHSRENNIIIDGNPTGRFNFLYNLSKIRGKYIALCEGDDYWTDPYKLQKQVDILENDNSIGLVHTSCKFLDDKKKTFYATSYASSDCLKYSFNKLFLRNTIFTCTTMFRTDLIKNFKNIPSGDISLWLYIALKSKIMGIKDVTSVYRKIENNSASKWNNPNERIKVLENWVSIRLFYYMNDDIPLYLMIEKYILHIINMLKCSVRLKKFYPLYQGLVFIKKGIIEIIKNKE